MLHLGLYCRKEVKILIRLYLVFQVRCFAIPKIVVFDAKEKFLGKVSSMVRATAGKGAGFLDGTYLVNGDR